MARQREPYADRIARLEAQGYTRAQARGHPEEARQPSIAAVRAVGAGRTARMDTMHVGGKEVLVVAVITPGGKLRVFEMDPAAKAKLKTQVTELFPDAPEPEES